MKRSTRPPLHERSTVEQAQRTMAWLLYITDGYVANVEVALSRKVSNLMITNEERLLMLDAMQGARRTANKIRRRMQVLDPVFNGVRPVYSERKTARRVERRL